MRLLIVAQRVDSEDPILAFFHRWIDGFARRCDGVVALGQAVGAHALPDTVVVHSLGKERGAPLWRQLLRFWRLIWSCRSQYDVVFVHMSPIWVLLGWPLWRLLRKRVYLWYEVRRGGRVLRWAVACSHRTFSATSDGLPFVHPRNVIVGHGIDTSVFAPAQATRDPHLFFTVGRVTPIKRFEQIIDAVAAQGGEARLQIAGGPVRPDDAAYLALLRSRVESSGLADRFSVGFERETAVAAALRSCAVFLHACGGGLDKALLEAMASGCLVLSSSHAASLVLPAACTCGEAEMATALARLLALPPDEQARLRAEVRAIVERDHALPRLLDRLVAEMAA